MLALYLPHLFGTASELLLERALLPFQITHGLRGASGVPSALLKTERSQLASALQGGRWGLLTWEEGKFDELREAKDAS